MKIEKCACVDTDARRCLEKRYRGTTPENEEAMRSAVCECPCHEDDEDDECDCWDCAVKKIV